ncbi:hypothetical protein LTR78_010643 [Recurvomyces mirabilis]|uniref:Uncharacterized protein n=1 Tax=Recurvomyces mirabilis TaxID=574656 RepID=A0AAE0TRR8_9PEZI|nr:hypothetical protein LTR78_010643 [Recurvomyces mirabilis]KAK5149563.1 hypothetical protein LTS14_010821 [Recurvomyces mirabilis]
MTFQIFERDTNPYHRGKGWALYSHWVLDDFLSLLPQHLINRLPETYIDPQATARGENGRFTFFDLSTDEAKWQVPPTRRLRLSRNKLRNLLLDGIDVQWAKRGVNIIQDGEGLEAHFDNGFTVAVPVRFLGASTITPADVGKRFKELDPFCFQGGDPQTDSFLFFSFLDTPTSNDRNTDSDFEC